IVAQGPREILEAAKRIRGERAQTRRVERIARMVEISNANAPLPQDRKYPIILADTTLAAGLSGPSRLGLRLLHPFFMGKGPARVRLLGQESTRAVANRQARRTPSTERR